MTETEMLRRLLMNFYINYEGNLEWMWQEGYSLEEDEDDLNQACLKYIADNRIVTH